MQRAQEANAYGYQLGAHTHFQVEENSEWSAQGYFDLKTGALQVVEKLNELELKRYDATEFALMVSRLRQKCQVHARAAGTIFYALEQWMVLQSTGMKPCDTELLNEAGAALSPLL